MTIEPIANRLRWGKLLMVLLSLVCAAPLIEAFEAKQVSKEGNFACNFDEGDVNDILASLKMTNHYVYEIERDSRGAAMFAYFEDIGAPNWHWVLALTEKGLVLTNFPGVTNRLGVNDSLEKVYWYQGSRCVFASGPDLPWKGKSKISSLQVRGTPGNEMLSLRYSDESKYQIASAAAPLTPLITTDGKTEIGARQLFYKNNVIYLFDLRKDGTNRMHWEYWTYRRKDGQWERDTRGIIPDAQEVVDLDPSSSNVLYYKWGAFSKKTFLFNLETKKSSSIGIKIWRNHGYFLRPSLVSKIKAELRAREGAR